MKIALPITAALLLTALTAVSRAESPQERQACENDAFNVCGQAIPDRHRVFLCLLDNLNSLSPPCRNVMAGYAQERGRATVGRGPARDDDRRGD